MLAWTAALAIGFSACGGGNSNDDGNGGDFTAQANAVCTDSAKQSVQISQDAAPIASAADAKAYLEALKPARQEAVDSLGALEPPADAADAYKSFIEKRQEGVDQIDEGIAATGQDSTEEDFAAARARSQEISDEARALAEDAGLDVCAGILSDEAQKLATDNITEAGLSSAPDVVCDKLATEAFVSQQFGDRQACADAQDPSTVPEDLDVKNLRGTDGVEATADVTLIGGSSDGQSFEVSTVYDDGLYKVDGVSPIGG